jgi:hypothetical protein
VPLPTTPSLTATPISPRLSSNPPLPKIKKIKDFTGLSGSNFTLSLLSGTQKLKDYNNFFNTSYKKIQSFNIYKNSGMISKDSKDEISQMNQSSTFTSAKPKLLKASADSHIPQTLDLDKDPSNLTTRVKSKENKLKYVK